MKKTRILHFFIALTVCLTQLSPLNATVFPYPSSEKTVPVYAQNTFYPVAFPQNNFTRSPFLKPIGLAPSGKQIALPEAAKSPPLLKKNSRKAIVVAMVVIGVIALVGVGGYLYWRYLQQQTNDSQKLLVKLPIVTGKPTSVITGNSSLEEKVQKHLSKQSSQLKIDGGHAYDAYIDTLEKTPNLFNVRELVLNKTGNAKLVHAPDGTFGHFDQPGVHIQKQQHFMSWQAFRRISQIPALQHVEHLTLEGFAFSPDSGSSSGFKQHEKDVESVANCNTLRNHFPHLQSLKLENCSLDQQFATVLQKHPLKKLEIVNSSFQPAEGFHHLFHAKSPSSLTAVSVVGCGLNDHQATEILYEPSLNTVEAIDFSNNHLSANFLFKRTKNFLTFWKTSRTLPISLQRLVLSNTDLLSENISQKVTDKSANNPNTRCVFNDLKNHPSLILDLGPQALETPLIVYLKKVLKERLQYQ